MSELTVAAQVSISTWLRSLAAHLETYGPLATTMRLARPSSHDVHVYPWDEDWDGSHLRVLVAWAATLADVSPVRVSARQDNGGAHLKLSGRMGDQSPVTVTVVVGPDETLQLAEKIPLAEGVTFPVGAVGELVTAIDPAAEAVA